MPTARLPVMAIAAPTNFWLRLRSMIRPPLEELLPQLGGREAKFLDHLLREQAEDLGRTCQDHDPGGETVQHPASNRFPVPARSHRIAPLERTNGLSRPQ